MKLPLPHGSLFGSTFVMKHLLIQQHVFFLLLLAAMSAALSSCVEKGDGPEIPNVNRTVLVYMVADNSLGAMGYDRLNIDEMLAAAKAGGLNGGNLLVYHNRRGTATGNVPLLLNITKNGIDTLKRYSDNPDVFSTDPARMREVCDDMRRFASAEDYGLVLWSHGDGWLEPRVASSQGGVKRAFGQDRNKTMKVIDLAGALEGQNFSWIYFDCCLMGTVEVVYELRNVTRRIVASGTELPLNGMPYDQNVPLFFAVPPGGADLVGAAQNTFRWYDALTGDKRTCAISVYDTSGFDRLAEATREIMAAGFVNFDVSYWKVQPYDRPSIPICSLYDMKEYISTMLAAAAIDDTTRGTLLARWESAFDECVIYAATTPVLFGDLPMSTYCGLGCFIIMQPSEATYRGYKNQSWYRDVISTAPVFNN